MTFYLGDHFFRAVQASPLRHEYAGRSLTVEGHGPDVLRVRENSGTLLACITRYSESASGTLPAAYPKDVLAPLFRTLDEALASLRLPWSDKQ